MLFLLAACPLHAQKNLTAANDASAETTPAAPELAALAWPEGEQVARVAFSEERQFPFRRFPKRFNGTIDRAPNGELILCYTGSSSERLLLLEDGIYFEDAGGHRQRLPAEAGYVRVLRDLIGGDQEALRRDWRIEPQADGFVLYPQAPELERSLKRVEVTVEKGRVAAVKVYLSDGVVRRYFFEELTWVPREQFGQPPVQP